MKLSLRRWDFNWTWTIDRALISKGGNARHFKWKNNSKNTRKIIACLKITAYQENHSDSSAGPLFGNS